LTRRAAHTTLNLFALVAEWQTRMVEGHVPKGVKVRLLSSALGDSSLTSPFVLRYTVSYCLPTISPPQERPMSSNLNTRLSQAYGLIEADDLSEAVALLKPVLAENPNNADAWWLYAHAVDDADDARAALSTVLSLDPNYPEAQRLLDLLDEASRGAGNPLNDMSLQPIRTIPDLPPAMPEDDEMPGFEREFAYGSGAKPQAEAGLPWLRIIGLGAAFVVALGAAFLFSQSAFAPAEPTASVQFIAEEDIAATATSIIETATAQAVAQSTLSSISDEDLFATATAIVEGQGTVATVDSAPINATATALVADQGGGALGTLAVAAAATPTIEALPVDPSIVQPVADALVSTFGEGSTAALDGGTLDLGLCSEAQNVDLRDTLRRAVELLSRQGDVLNAGLGEIRFRLLDCATGSAWRTLTGNVGDVQAFAAGEFDAAAFEARLAAE
jgi:tetratricopeptide (TPR) repeat protein